MKMEDFSALNTISELKVENDRLRARVTELEAKLLDLWAGKSLTVEHDRDRYRDALAEISEELSRYPEGNGIFGYLKQILRRALGETHHD